MKYHTMTLFRPDTVQYNRTSKYFIYVAGCSRIFYYFSLLKLLQNQAKMKIISFYLKPLGTTGVLQKYLQKILHK